MLFYYLLLLCIPHIKTVRYTNHTQAMHMFTFTHTSALDLPAHIVHTYLITYTVIQHQGDQANKQHAASVDQNMLARETEQLSRK